MPSLSQSCVMRQGPYLLGTRSAYITCSVDIVCAYSVIKDISQSQRDMLISLWETKGMRTAKSEHLNEATINTGLSKNQIKCGKLEEIGVAVGGMAFVNDTFNAFGSRDVRPYFLEPSVQSGFIEILHCGKACST
ncbi:unnamed protein product [Clavelina lepadiformis]|uniref:Uncharacterized protein n=1 Tax=Clavelina lepadiformis TaxID=159417 RepID=A0ABP0FCP2_CLALP